MSGPAENLVTSCPQCNSLVGLPSVLSLDATVRCPVCNHKYTLRSRLPQAIPPLELVVGKDDLDDDSEPDGGTIDPTAKLQVNEILRKNAKLNRRRKRRGSSRAERNVSAENAPAETRDVFRGETTGYADFQAAVAGTLIEESPETAGQAGWESAPNAGLKTAGDLAAYERKQAGSRSRHRRSSSSRQSQQWAELVKIALGAVLALPVAQLIIWWGLSIDPLKLAPSVVKYVPFVVPAKVLEANEEK